MKLKSFRPRLRGTNLKSVYVFSKGTSVEVSVPDYGELILNWFNCFNIKLFSLVQSFRPRLRGTNLKLPKFSLFIDCGFFVSVPDYGELILNKSLTLSLFMMILVACFRPRLRGTNLKPYLVMMNLNQLKVEFPSPITGN